MSTRSIESLDYEILCAKHRIDITMRMCEETQQLAEMHKLELITQEIEYIRRCRDEKILELCRTGV